MTKLTMYTREVFLYVENTAVEGGVPGFFSTEFSFTLIEKFPWALKLKTCKFPAGHNA